MTTQGAIMAGDAVRTYLAELRKRRKITQQQVADDIGVGVLSWKKYESGKTEDPSSSFLLAAIRALGGSFDHLRQLSGVTATEELGKELAALRAEEWAAKRAEDAMLATLSDEEWTAYAQDEKQRAEQTQEEARLAADRLNRLLIGRRRR